MDEGLAAHGSRCRCLQHTCARAEPPILRRLQEKQGTQQTAHPTGQRECRAPAITLNRDSGVTAATLLCVLEPLDSAESKEIVLD